jgi:uncharacterized membrane protein
MLRWFRQKKLFTQAENKRIIEALQAAEKQTSGEIRIFIEARNPLVSTMERALSAFLELQMDKTEQRNAVLIYLAVKDREVAIYGDTGIHELVGNEFWEQQVNQMILLFKENNLTDGLVKCLHEVGRVLSEKFPYKDGMDKNELPDEIVFG